MGSLPAGGIGMTMDMRARRMGGGGGGAASVRHGRSVGE